MNAEKESAVLCVRKGPVMWVQLNRPQALNAINDEIRVQLPRAVRDADNDPEVRVIVLHGAGEKGFCAGADIKGFGDAASLTLHRQARLSDHWMAALNDVRKPLIAAIHGYCLGGGVEMSLLADIRVASDDAVFALPEVSRATMPGVSGTHRLSRIIGLGRALDMVLSAERMTAAEAQRVGLVTRVVKRAELEAQVQKLAETIAAHGPIAMMFAKEAIRKGGDRDFGTALVMSTDLLTILRSTEDRLEASAAFKEKRKPSYKGK